MASPGRAELTVGIMSVVTEMGRNVEDEREPTWDEAIAALETATPVEVVRPPREVQVIYRYADGIFTATSPDVKGFRVTGPSMHETRAYARQDLEKFLDPDVKVKELFPARIPRSAPVQEVASGSHLRLSQDPPSGSSCLLRALSAHSSRRPVPPCGKRQHRDPRIDTAGRLRRDGSSR